MVIKKEIMLKTGRATPGWIAWPTTQLATVSRECLNHEPEKHNKVGESPRGSPLCVIGSHFLDHIGRKVIILVHESIIIQLIVNGRLPALGRDPEGEIQQKDGNSKMDRKAHTSLYQDDAIIIHPHNAHLGGR